MKKIIARVYGGIGNQLFIYASSRRLAYINNAELVLDNVTGFRQDYEYKRTYQLDNFNINVKKIKYTKIIKYWPRGLYWFLKKINQFKSTSRKNYIKEKNGIFNEYIMQFKVKNTLYLEGYWQSEEYFKDIKIILKEELTIKPPVDAKNIKIADSIKKSKNSVAIHIRFFSEAIFSNPKHELSDYYEKAIKKIEEKFEKVNYFIFSDKPELAKKIFLNNTHNVEYINNNNGDELAYADLWLMTLCENFIIANSTFSWWGAWLSNNDNKIIICPDPIRFELNNPWRSEKLLPSEWIKI